MYCNACGSPNPDGSAFCSTCGKPLVAPLTPQPVATPVSQPKPLVSVQLGNTEESFHYPSYFRRLWREFVVAPLPLALIIVYSALFLISVYNAFNTILNIDAYMSILGELGIGKPKDIQGWMILLTVLGMVPEILTIVGCWLIYSDAAQRTDRPIKTVGFTMIKAAQVIYLVTVCIIAVATFVGCCVIMDGYPGSIQLFEVICLWAFIFGFVIANFILKIKFANGARDAADFCIPYASCAIILAVFQFIEAAMGLISLFENFNMLLTIIPTCAAQVMFGILLIQYKSHMDFLAWKKQSVEQWRCSCGRIHQKYETSCTCGLSKADVQTGN